MNTCRLIGLLADSLHHGMLTLIPRFTLGQPLSSPLVQWVELGVVLEIIIFNPLQYCAPRGR